MAQLTNTTWQVDAVVVVSAPRVVQEERVLSRPGMTQGVQLCQHLIRTVQHYKDTLFLDGLFFHRIDFLCLGTHL
jgi:dephospho-CoA kinase